MGVFKRQLSIIVNGIKNMLDNNFSTKIPVITRTEAGVLAQTLNDIALFYSEASFFSNTQIANLALQHKLPRHSVIKKTAVLSCNIVNIDERIGKSGLVDAASTVNNFYERLEQCAALTGGYVEHQLYGKAVVHFGLINNLGWEHAVPCALRCALLLRVCFALDNKKNAEEGTGKNIYAFGISLDNAYLSRYKLDGSIEYHAKGRAVDAAILCGQHARDANTDIALSRKAFYAVKKTAAAETVRLADGTEVFALVNVRGKKENSRLANAIAHITGINLKEAFLFAGYKGPRTLQELRQR